MLGGFWLKVDHNDLVSPDVKDKSDRFVVLDRTLSPEETNGDRCSFSGSL